MLPVKKPSSEDFHPQRPALTRRKPAALKALRSQEFSPQAAQISDSELHLERYAGYESRKRAIDVLGATSLLLGLSPVMLTVAALVRLSSPGPAIFSQRRLTKGGKEFTMLKFRTMTLDAETGTGPVWAIAGDSRVTTLGRVLRFSRLDELPQLFNVLRGDMSLIGPRPERPEIAGELSKQLRSFHRRMEVKAGITGLAQIGAGYASCLSSYRRKLALDILYIKKRSLLLDLRIALQTIIVVITGTGAR